MSLRILHIDHTAVLGGAERSVIELASAQVLSGHSVWIAGGGTGAFLDLAAERGISVVSLDMPPQYAAAPSSAGIRRAVRAASSLAAASRRIADAIADVAPDVVHVHTRKSQLATAAVLRHRRPVLFHLRDAVPRAPVLRMPVVMAVRRAAHAVALSQWMIPEYRAARAVPRSGRIGVVPSGVDQRALSRLPTPWLDGHAPARVGFVGQIASWKGPHLLVELAELLAARHDATFHIVGSVLFPEAEQRYGDWLKRRVDDSPVRGSITWHPATALPEAAMSEIDILVHTSQSPEPFGRVLVEAMASRRPIVAFRRGSTTDMLTDETALLARGDSVEELARALEAVLADPAAAAQMTVRAAEAARAYEPARVAKLMDTEYERVAR